jgi:hypothetical protein
MSKDTLCMPQPDDAVPKKRTSWIFLLLIPNGGVFVWCIIHKHIITASGGLIAGAILVYNIYRAFESGQIPGVGNYGRLGFKRSVFPFGYWCTLAAFILLYILSVVISLLICAS